MTREETKELLMILEATFPNFDVKDPRATVAAWQLMLEEYPYENVKMAVKVYVSTQNTAFAPSASQLIAMMRKPAELTQMDEATAWAQVRKAISRGNYYSVEEFEKLPPEAQSVVRTPEQIKMWAAMPSDEIDTVVRSNFRRSFETQQKRDLEIKAMPAEVRQAIENKMQNLLVCS